MVYLHCDGGRPDCETQGEEASGVDGNHTSIAAYKKEMKTYGWVFIKDKAYCPVCNKARGE